MALLHTMNAVWISNGCEIGRQQEDAIAAMCKRLAVGRKTSLQRFGTVVDGVLTRLGPTFHYWPANAIGTLRMVRRPDSVMLVTDGLSNPWNPSLHARVPEWTFGFELAIEIPFDAFEDTSNDAIAASWAPEVLWAATDWVVAERVNLLARIAQHDAITHALPSVRGLEHLVGRNKCIGGLIGMPFVGSTLGVSAAHGPDPYLPRIQTCLLTMKLLTADEYDWAEATDDGSRARALAERFMAHRDRHWSRPRRSSIRQ